MLLIIHSKIIMLMDNQILGSRIISNKILVVNRRWTISFRL